jgi:hypothetical protein
VPAGGERVGGASFERKRFVVNGYGRLVFLVWGSRYAMTMYEKRPTRVWATAEGACRLRRRALLVPGPRGLARSGRAEVCLAISRGGREL